jgi:hypothetical protein
MFAPVCGTDEKPNLKKLQVEFESNHLKTN